MIPLVGLYTRLDCNNLERYMPTLTELLVAAAEPHEKQRFIWDDLVKGFGVRVLPSGRKSFVIQYRFEGRVRRLTLCSAEHTRVPEARKRARKVLDEVAQGNDPADKKRRKQANLTVKELAERFDAEHIAVRVKASTAKEYRRNLRQFIVPKLGRYRVSELSRAHVAEFHHDLRHIPYQANRCLEQISKMFNLAEMWGLRTQGTNPRRHVKKFPEKKRERFLSPAEIRRLVEVLDDAEREGLEMPSAILAFRLLMLTGCRLGEILSLQWSYVDLDGGLLHLPDSKTGAKRVALGQAAVELLRRAERIDGNPYVIVGAVPHKPLSNIHVIWARIRARAGLKDARIHDLRHTFASVAASLGHDLTMIGKLLGHKSLQSTARYAHIRFDHVRNSADAVSSEIMSYVKKADER